MEFVDLHTHSHASDGSDSPAELVQHAAAAQLSAVALTDHDTISGLAEAEAEGRVQGIEVIRGCELSVASVYGEIHILGLWIPSDKNSVQELETQMYALRAHRTERNHIIVKKLQQLGLHIDYDDVLEAAAGETVGRPHIAKVLVSKGYVPTIKDAFGIYLGSDGKAYEAKKVWEMEQAVTQLVRIGATVSMAHPGLIHCPFEWLDTTVGQLKALGLSAIEAYHSDHTAAAEADCVRLAKKYDLALSGGSDYHGTAKPHISLGKGRGGLRVPLYILEVLKKQRQEKGLPI